MKVLQISAHFPPNLGGVETHLLDLTQALVRRKWQVFVLTYRPLTTKVKWEIYESSSNLKVLRIPWIPGFFYAFIRSPILEFLYLVPGLFFTLPLFMFIFNPNVVHGHGLVAGFVAIFWGKLLRKRVIISTHSIYQFPLHGLYRTFVKWIFSRADFILGLSKQAADEIASLGIMKSKIDAFTYWIDLDKFKEKKKLTRARKFTVLFVGRLIEEKGIIELLQAAKIWNKDIHLVIIGSGPLEENIKNQIPNIKNVKYLGMVDNDKLPLYYRTADITVVPSIHEEGFGRVILESLSCGTPVIGSRKGAIPEAMNENVGRLIEISPKIIKNEVEYFFTHQKKLMILAGNCRKFAERRYSEKNVEKIIKTYEN